MPLNIQSGGAGNGWKWQRGPVGSLDILRNLTTYYGGNPGVGLRLSTKPLMLMGRGTMAYYRLMVGLGARKLGGILRDTCKVLVF